MDDGIFTPYIISRRSDTSYSDSSDKENDSPIHIEKKFSIEKTLNKPKFSSDSDKDRKSNSYNSDTDSFKSAISELSPITKPDSHDIEKDLSWCFSEKETSCESELDDAKTTTDQSTPVNVPRRKSSVSTPITFRLNNIKKHTPTPQRLSTPDGRHESWLFLRSLSSNYFFVFDFVMIFIVE